MTELVRTRPELDKALAALRARRPATGLGAGSAAGLVAGPAARRAATPRVALVPTMGALHQGHRELLRVARTVAEVVVASIFVNPLQFGDPNDLRMYPRTLTADLELCAAEDVALVWAPEVADMYPAGPPQVRVSSGELGTRYEGAARPGHFDGMLTVVARLLGTVRPDVAVFGRKDAQQLFLVTRMVADLELGTEILPVHTVREPDGLARSSRNARLSEAGHTTAELLPLTLAATRAAAAAGATVAQVHAAATEILALGEHATPPLIADEVAIVDPETFAAVAPDHEGNLLVLIAGRVEGVRLIDNVLLRREP